MAQQVATSARPIEHALHQLVSDTLESSRAEDSSNVLHKNPKNLPLAPPPWCNASPLRPLPITDSISRVFRCEASQKIIMFWTRPPNIQWYISRVPCFVQNSKCSPHWSQAASCIARSSACNFPEMKFTPFSTARRFLPCLIKRHDTKLMRTSSQQLGNHAMHGLFSTYPSSCKQPTPPAIASTSIVNRIMMPLPSVSHSPMATQIAWQSVGWTGGHGTVKLSTSALPLRKPVPHDPPESI